MWMQRLAFMLLILCQHDVRSFADSICNLQEQVLVFFDNIFRLDSAAGSCYQLLFCAQQACCQRRKDSHPLPASCCQHGPAR